MFCSYCANPLSDDLAFCTNCGKPTRNYPAEPETVVRPTPRVTEPEPGFTTEPSAAPRSNLIWFLLGGIVIVLIGFGGAAGLYFAINSSNDNSAKNINTANAGTPRNQNSSLPATATPTPSPTPAVNLNSNTSPSPTPATVDGRYRNKMGDVHIDAPNAKGFDFEIEIGTHGCAGNIDGKAIWTKQNVSAVAKVKNEDWEYDPDTPNIKQYCTLTFNFSGSKMDISEDSCLWFHGAACEFEGSYSKK